MLSTYLKCTHSSIFSLSLSLTHKQRKKTTYKRLSSSESHKLKFILTHSNAIFFPHNISTHFLTHTHLPTYTLLLNNNIPVQPLPSWSALSCSNIHRRVTSHLPTKAHFTHTLSLSITQKYKEGLTFERERERKGLTESVKKGTQKSGKNVTLTFAADTERIFFTVSLKTVKLLL